MSNILHHPVIAPMLKELHIRSYPKNQTIIYPEDQSPYVYLIKEGAVAMQDFDQGGERKVLYIFGPKTLFPITSFVTGAVTNTWFYSALTDTEVYLLPLKDLQQRLEKTDGLSASNVLLQQFLQEVHELIVRITNSTKTSSMDKLVAALKLLATHHTKTCSGSWQPVKFPVSQQLLADMTGLTRETVNISMKELQRKKIIRYPSITKLELNPNKLYKE